MSDVIDLGSATITSQNQMQALKSVRTELKLKTGDKLGFKRLERNSVLENNLRVLEEKLEKEKRMSEAYTVRRTLNLVGKVYVEKVT